MTPDETELARLRKIAQLAEELFTMESEVAQLRVGAISVDDERDSQEVEDELRALVGVPKHTEPELQHQFRCEYPTGPCDCRRSHLIAEANRLRGMIHPHLAGHLFNVADGLVERGHAALRGDEGIGDAYLELHRAAELIEEVLKVNYIERPT